MDTAAKYNLIVHCPICGKHIHTIRNIDEHSRRDITHQVQLVIRAHEDDTKALHSTLTDRYAPVWKD